MKRIAMAPVFAAVAFAAIPAVAVGQTAPDMVTASDPDGVVSAMAYAGYEATLGTDAYGDPKIDSSFGGWSGAVWFYGCDELTNEGCTSLQLVVGFDRKNPMPLETLNEIASSQRFVAIYLDEEGDPWLKWDIVTEGGIPAGVFNSSLQQYSQQVAAIADVVFEAEWAEEEAAAVESD
jgi:hypothetical protein